MDPAKQQAITACGRPGCGYPEDDHNFRAGTDSLDIAVLAALGGPCTSFVASDAAVIYAKHLAIADNREPRYQPGRVGRRGPMCGRCAHRGHQTKDCPL